MARRRFGHEVIRPGRKHGDEPVSIPVAKDLEKAPDSLRRDQEITFYSREYPLESFALEQSASVDWADGIRREFSPETAELYEEFQEDMKPALEWVRASGDLEPTAEPSGDDVTQSIRDVARELGYSEVGFTRFDRRYVYKARQDDVRRGLPNAICLALEQEHSATQTMPSLDAEVAQGATYKQQAELAKKLVQHIHSLGYRAQVSGPTWQFGPMIPMFVDAGLGQLGVNGQLLSPHFGPGRGCRSLSRMLGSHTTGPWITVSRSSARFARCASCAVRDGLSRGSGCGIGVLRRRSSSPSGAVP